MKTENRTQIFDIYYMSIDVEVREQLPAMDAPTWVSNLGGGLGLFLGISFFDIAIWAYKQAIWCCKILRKRFKGKQECGDVELEENGCHNTTEED